MKIWKRLVGLCLAVLGATHALADPGVSDTSISIGMSAPFSGTNGAYGVDMRDTIAAYLDQVNRSGGVNGRRIELIAVDDGYETERTVANTTALINEKKVFALVGFYGSTPTTEAMNTVFGPARVPLIGTISGAGSLRQAIAEHGQLDADTICRDDRCPLGQWLHGQGGQRWGSQPGFVALLEKHAEFHGAAGAVARQINGGAYADAERLIGSGSAFARASNEVATLLMRAKRGF